MDGTQSYKSFGEQALHYFRRDHESVRREPIAGPAAWRGADLANDPSWQVPLGADDVREIDAAIRAVRDRGLPLGRTHRADFPLPTLAARVADWRRELVHGRGFLVLRGLPVKDWGDEDAGLAFWGLGLHLGHPGAQNPAEELLGHVVDTGEERTNPNIRRYRTSGDIAYHCDLADVVGLLCLRAARAGGASRLVSSVSVYNELLARRPDLVDRLYEPFLLDGRDEGRDGKARVIPVPPCRHAGGVLRTFYHSDYFRSVVRHADVPPFTEEEQTLRDLYEEIAASPELRLDMQFAPGDVQLVSNHTVLHARTAYEDDPSPGQERHLLRLWLSLESD
ncbi:MAG: TauD/TfdA family dioxygenase [Myxococcota bacterium]